MVIVSGPTAVGKTATAIALAQHYNTEIISADSRQVYKELNIGTAKPTPKELNAAPHHFINHISIHKTFSAGQYETEALAKIETLFKKHNIVICAGGTGLYIKAIIEGFDDIPAINNDVREKVIEIYQQFGIEKLQDEVKKYDPDSYAKIDTQNPQRLMRVLEVFLATGKPISSFQKKSKKNRSFNVINIGLQMERAILYDRINLRVDQMIKNGLIEEVKTLLPFENLNALQTVGYSEIFDYLNNKHSLERAIELIKRNSRRYAKRQLTWFRKESDITWFEPSEIEKIINHIDETITSSN